MRDYGVEGQIGAEDTIEEYVQTLVEVFREVRRVLRNDGTCWIVIGDSYNGSGGAGGDYNAGGLKEGQPRYKGRRIAGLKAKDLIGVPWRVGFALQADGWWLRSDIVWRKSNSQPESVRDRPSKSHEYIFLLTKQAKYFYDIDATRQPHSRNWWNETVNETDHVCVEHNDGGNQQGMGTSLGANVRSVWEFATIGFTGSHFAVYPPKLVERCLKLGSSERGCCPKCGAPVKRVVERKPMQIHRSTRREAMGQFGRTQASGTMVAPAESGTTGWSPSCKCDAGPPIPCTVLDPFLGSGTTGLVASRLRRDCIGVELNRSYADMAYLRIVNDAPLLNVVEIVPTNSVQNADTN